MHSAFFHAIVYSFEMNFTDFNFIKIHRYVDIKKTQIKLFVSRENF